MAIYSSTINREPSDEIPVGSEFGITPARLRFNFASTESTIVVNSEFAGTLLSICIRSKGVAHSLVGTGVLVGSGVAITAAHVINDFIPDIVDGNLGTLVIGYSINAMHLWVIRKINILPETDLAILGLSLVSDIPPVLTVAAISTKYPGIGETVYLVGARASKAVYQGDNYSDQFLGQVTINAFQGVVSNRYPIRRDESMLRGPSLQVECSSFSGMSGGPVFNNEGSLIGILSSSYDGGPSYASLVWPLLTMGFRGGWPRSAFPDIRTLVDSADCYIDDRTLVTRNHSRGITSYTVPGE
ncbi:MAG TPA: serine protease [Chryseolinea sp.]|nr:serine protease [Chryseolinea sp.]